MRRGEVWWAELPPPQGPRPVLILSRDSSISVRGLVVVALVTTRKRGLPVEVPLETADGMPKPCVVNPDVLDTVLKSRLRRRLCALRPEKLVEVEKALHFALALDCPGTLRQTGIIAP